MKKILFSILTLVLGLVLSGSGCGPDPIVDPGTTDAGVKIGDVTWATRNVGAFRKFADNPEDAGMFYQWNRAKAWPATGATVTGWDATTPSGSEWVPANDPCPTGWKVPTKAQMTALTAAGYEWDAAKKGILFGIAPNQIFLPAAGFRNDFDGSLDGEGVFGCYWNKAQVSEIDADNMGIGDLGVDPGSTSKVYALSVRCVKI